MRLRRRRNARMSTRKRQEAVRTIRRRVLFGLGIAALGLMAMTADVRSYLADAVLRSMGAVQTAAWDQHAEVTLEEKDVYALQLGAFDNGQRAQDELNRLQGERVPCVLWQRAQMRLVCDAAWSKAVLSAAAAGDRDVWVIADTWPQVVLRITADAAGIEQVCTLLHLPDALFDSLCAHQESISAIAARAKQAAQPALTAYPDNALYTQLAQSLVNWCALMENAVQAFGEEAARPYARVTMCTLCYELRQALISYAAQSAASTASAQRTPSTAADVMPPA
ncbi:MAG: hypothetical protein IKB82_00940 [Clostridia bacterium]|nr:hypothetical protein [Clostridia bacterium]